MSCSGWRLSAVYIGGILVLGLLGFVQHIVAERATSRPSLIGHNRPQLIAALIRYEKQEETSLLLHALNCFTVMERDRFINKSALAYFDPNVTM